jgi:glutathione S-transferase
MITVHHLENSRSHRVLWLLEELGLEYRIEPYARDPKTSLAPPALEQVHPLGKSPVITDGDVTVAESAAILEYLLEAHGQGRFAPAAGTEAHRRYRYFMHYAEGSLMPLLVMKLVFNRVENAPVPFFLRPVVKGISKQVNDAFIGPNLGRHVAFLEGELGQHTWLTGPELTAADIQMSFPLMALAVRGGIGDRCPHILRFVSQVEDRPAFQRAVERGGPLQILG